jgi:hypothetical protein
MNYEPLLSHNGFSMDGALVGAGSHNPKRQKGHVITIEFLLKKVA